jgi:hypothetical protein
MTELPVIPRKTRCDLEGFQEAVEVGGVDEDAAPPTPAAQAVVGQAALLAPQVDELWGQAF